MPLGKDGTKGQELVEIHPDETAAGRVLEVAAQAKRKKGYQHL